MAMKKTLGYLVGALLAFVIGVAVAGQKDRSREEPDEPKKARRGEPCNTNADCDQSFDTLRCEKNKCQPDPNAPPPRRPPVT